MARKLATLVAVVAAVALLGQTAALANHVVNVGPIPRASSSGYTICGTSTVSPDFYFGTHAYGTSTTRTHSSSSCSGSTASGASVRAKGTLLWNNGGWTICGATADSGYVASGSVSVTSFNTFGCGTGTYANATTHGGWITGIEYPAVHWPIIATHTGY